MEDDWAQDILPGFKKKFLKDDGIAIKFPAKVLMEITARCNFRCPHCYFASNQRVGELTYSQVCAIFDKLADAGCLYLSITGGEPLIHHDFWKILKYARKRDFAVKILTNGSLITKETARRLADLAIMTAEISIYGMNESTYKLVTGVKGVFRKVMEAIDWLRNEGIRVTLKAIPLRENFSQLKAFDGMVARLRVRARCGWDLFPRLNGSKIALRYGLTNRQLKEFFTDFPHHNKPDFKRKACYARTFCINYRGEAMPCLLLSSLSKHESILIKSVAEILKDNSNYRRLEKLCRNFLPGCLHCALVPYCVLCFPVAALYVGSASMPAAVPINSYCRSARLKKSIYERSIVKNKRFN